MRELGVLLSESLSVVEGRVAVMDEDLKNGLEAMEKKVMPQRIVQLERLSGQVDHLPTVEAQIVAALRASKKQTVRVAKKVTELEDHEVSASVQTVLARAVKNLEQWGDDLLKISWRTWNSAACEACAAGLRRDTNTRHYRSSRAVLGRGCRGRWTRSFTEASDNFTHFNAELELGFFLTSTLYLAVTFVSVYVCVWKISHAPCSSPWKSGHYAFKPLVFSLTLFRFARFDSGYMYSVSLGAFGRDAHICYVKGNLVFEVKSCPALWLAASWYGEMCTVDPSVAVFASVFLWTYRSQLTLVCSPSGYCRSRVFPALGNSHL